MDLQTGRLEVLAQALPARLGKRRRQVDNTKLTKSF